MLLAMAAVMAASTVTRGSDRARLDAELGEHAAVYAKSIGARLQRTMDAVTSPRSFYRSSAFVSRTEFRTFTETLLAAHPELQALSWGPVVPHAERARYVEEARAAGLSGYRLTERAEDGKLVEAASRPH